MGRRLIFLLAIALGVEAGVSSANAQANLPPEVPPPPSPASAEGNAPGDFPAVEEPAAPRRPKAKAKAPAAAGPRARPLGGTAGRPAMLPELPAPTATSGGVAALPGAPSPSGEPAPASVDKPLDPVPAMPPADALPPPHESPAPAPSPPSAPVPPTLDPEVEKAQLALPGLAKGTKAAPIQDTGPLPPAAEPPGQPPSAASTREPDQFILPPDRIPLGRQSVALTVEVIGPATLNINQSTTLKIVVRNTGTAPAMGVVVRDELPPGLTFLSSQPAEQRGSDSFLFWRLGVVDAGAERSILVKVKPTKVGQFDHAATVTMMAGGKSRTLVREPRLKVEQIATRGNVLKGQPVQFKITVSNPGDGPARKVTIQAKLSPGLKSDSGEPNDPQNLFEQTLDQINAGERVVLDPLVADTMQGGEQSCRVVALSPDVAPGQEEAQNVQTVTVVEPKLKMTVTGDPKRFTDTIASYTVTVENPGTAAARNVKVVVTLPTSGKLLSVPAGATYQNYTRRFQCSFPQVEPGEKEKVSVSFQVRVGAPGLYQVAVEAKGDGALADKGSFSTDVSGMSMIDLEVAGSKSVVDIADTTTYQIRVRNTGTKEATALLISAKLSDNVEPVATDNGTDSNEEAKFDPGSGMLVFPKLERLGANKELTLRIKVKAIKAGQATCRVILTHDDLGDQKIDDMAMTRVTDTRRR